MKQFTTLRPAIAMIELIFAIVIMGIVMMSAPMLISTASKSGYVAIQQESINQAATQMNIILGYPWDENNTNEDYAPTVLNVTSGHAQLNGEINEPKRRAGTPNISKRLFITGNSLEFNASAIGSDAGDLDDMDDFDGTTVNLQLDGSTSTSDYIDNNISITRSVNYISDGPTTGRTYQIRKLYFTPNFTATATGTSNIKHIQVTLISNSPADELSNTQITLHAFSCNIGSYQLKEK